MKVGRVLTMRKNYENDDIKEFFDYVKVYEYWEGKQ
jgi:hypothetical protein